MRGNNNERGINLCTEINKILCHPFPLVVLLKNGSMFIKKMPAVGDTL